MAEGKHSSPLRTAVVGLGRIGYKYHLPAVARHADFQPVAAVDPLPERRAEVTTAHGIPAYATIEAMLDAVRPDLVVIASPTPVHVQQACAAFAAGAHVLCDKPVATHVADFERIVAGADRAGRKFLAYQPARYRPEVRALQALLARDLLGEVHLVKRARCNYVRRHDWQALRAHGGGMLNNYGSHCLDEWIALFGGEAVATVFCQTRSVATAGDAEDVVKATLVTARGRMLDLDISQACALPGPTWQVVGSRGAALFDDDAACWQVRYCRAAELPAVAVQSGLAAEGRSYDALELPWREETIALAGLAEFDYYDAASRYFRGEQAAPVSVAESRQLLELIERCRRSAETGACA